MTIFEQPINQFGDPSEFPIVSNVFGTRERCALALDLPPQQSKLELSLEYARLDRRQIAPEIVARRRCAVKEVVQRGDAIDIRRLPIVKHFEGDISEVVTMAAVMKDPDTGIYDVSFIKLFPKGPRKGGVSIHSPHLERILAKYEKRGRARAVRADHRAPPGVLPRRARAHDVRQRRLPHHRLVPWRAATPGPLRDLGEDFLIPADAEIIIEGEIPPASGRWSIPSARSPGSTRRSACGRC